MAPGQDAGSGSAKEGPSEGKVGASAAAGKVETEKPGADGKVVNLSNDLPYITREMLTQKRKLKVRHFVVPGFGRACVRELREREKQEIDNAAIRREGEKIITEYRGYRARAIAHALVDHRDEETPIFGNPMAEFEFLLDLPVIVLDALYDPVAEMNGLTRKAQEAMGKDSASTTAGASSSSSQ